MLRSILHLSSSSWLLSASAAPFSSSSRCLIKSFAFLLLILAALTNSAVSSYICIFLFKTWRVCFCTCEIWTFNCKAILYILRRSCPFSFRNSCLFSASSLWRVTIYLLIIMLLFLCQRDSLSAFTLLGAPLWFWELIKECVLSLEMFR